jgi:Cof subfamily protein (haloacid dehalogenase superfamily)
VAEAVIRLAAFDLDNTLIGRDLTLSPRVKAAVARALARGVVVTIATGRGIWPTAQFAAELGLTAPLICFQGGLVYDFRAQRILHETRLAPVVIPAIVRLAAERGWSLEFETPYVIYLQRGFTHSELLMDLLKTANLGWVDDFLTELPETPHKFLLSVSDPAQRDPLAAELRAAWDQRLARLTIVPSHPVLVEGIPDGLSKAVGLAWLAEQRGIRPEEVMAVGDYNNDVEMLEWAGLGVAMADGSPAALKAADEIVPPVTEDGAAVALEKFVLRET